MELMVIGSGSKGNGYIIQNDSDAIIIEAGMSMRSYSVGLGFNLKKVAACLVTHEHKDHSGHVTDIVKSGIPTFMSEGTAKSVFGENPIIDRVNFLKSGRLCKIGNWDVLPFDAKHDAAEPLGFLVRHKETGTFLFATDTYYLPCTFKGLNNIMIECNYDKEMVQSNMNSGKVHPSVAKRVLTSHLSVDHCIEALRNNDLSQVNNIVLIHLSGSNSDPIAFKERVHYSTGKNVFVAEKGLKIKFEKTPF